jgi:hypothetical protein
VRAGGSAATPVGDTSADAHAASPPPPPATAAAAEGQVDAAVAALLERPQPVGVGEELSALPSFELPLQSGAEGSIRVEMSLSLAPPSLPLQKKAAAAAAAAAGQPERGAAAAGQPTPPRRQRGGLAWRTFTANGPTGTDDMAAVRPDTAAAAAAATHAMA